MSVREAVHRDLKCPRKKRCSEDKVCVVADHCNHIEYGRDHGQISIYPEQGVVHDLIFCYSLIEPYWQEVVYILPWLLSCHIVIFELCNLN